MYDCRGALPRSIDYYSDAVCVECHGRRTQRYGFVPGGLARTGATRESGMRPVEEGGGKGRVAAAAARQTRPRCFFYCEKTALDERDPVVGHEFHRSGLYH